MLTGTELRVGNKFLGIAGVQTVLSILDHTSRGDWSGNPAQPGYEHLILVKENRNQYKPVEIDPIQITEEWLLKCGFERHHGDYFNNVLIVKNVIDINTGITNKSGFDFMVFPSGIGSAISIKNSMPIRSVHQLQNLFFALTGNELIIE